MHSGRCGKMNQKKGKSDFPSYAKRKEGWLRSRRGGKKQEKNEIKIDQQLESYPRGFDRRDIGLFVPSIGGM